MLSKEMVGIVTPKGIFHYGSPLKHQELLLGLDEFQAEFPEIKTIQDWKKEDERLYNESYDYFLEQRDPDELFGWHNFYPDTFMEKVYEEGFCRFVVHSDTLYLEGCYSGLYVLRKSIVSLVTEEIKKFNLPHTLKQISFMGVVGYSKLSKIKL